VVFRENGIARITADPLIFRVVDGHDDEMYACAGECVLWSCADRSSLTALTLVPLPAHIRDGDAALGGGSLSIEALMGPVDAISFRPGRCSVIDRGERCHSG
jgi:hypothetical protein